MNVIFDRRWNGQYGIGRFSDEIYRRILYKTVDITGDNPVSLKSLIKLEFQMFLSGKRAKVFFSPGFTPPVFWKGIFFFTIHDLIHLNFTEESNKLKNIYYNKIVLSKLKKAEKIFTVSEYSKKCITTWSSISPEKVIVVGNGVDPAFSAHGPVHQPGFPYVLYIRNTKPHKNVPRLLEAFARLDFSELKLLLSGTADDDTRHLALRLGIYDRVVFTGRIPEDELPAYYRGAAVVTMPSLYEGFGLPALEGMACGVPVVVSNTTSLPEVVGDAGILVDPYDVQSIADGLTQALTDVPLRAELRRRGLERAKLFNWDDVATKVQHELDLAGAK